jgi:hypothetical protein
VRAVLVDARPAGRPPAVKALLEGFDLAARCRVPTDRGSAPVEIYANSRALPRAFLVSGVAPASGPEDALSQLLAPGFDPRRSVVVESDPPLRPVPSEGEAPGDARITAYQTERVVVRAEAAAPSWLVLTDSFDPGWTATRASAMGDREPVEILPADGLFRAIPLPAGTWEVEFRYRARGFRLGAVIGAATLVLAFWLARRWRPQGPAQGPAIASSSIS